MKWVPAILWPVLQPRARGWGLIFLGLSALLSLAMLPLTIVQLQVLFGFGTGPSGRLPGLRLVRRAWWWRHRDPFAFLAHVVARGGSLPAGSGPPMDRCVPHGPRGTATGPGSGSASPSGAPSASRTAGGATGSPRPRRHRPRPTSPSPAARRPSGRRCRTWRRQICWRPARRLHHRAQRDRGQRVEDHGQREHDPRPGLEPARPGDGIEHDPAERDRQRRRRPGRDVDRPMYRPADARGMMSVISAQSTARNIPLDAPNSAAPTNATGIDGAKAVIRDPDRRRSHTPPRSAACGRAGRTGGTPG